MEQVKTQEGWYKTNRNETSTIPLPQPATRCEGAFGVLGWGAGWNRSKSSWVGMSRSGGGRAKQAAADLIPSAMLFLESLRLHVVNQLLDGAIQGIGYGGFKLVLSIEERRAL